ncbi:Aha1 protein [Saccharomycopsis crataegensis]|uniref:Aha1 protein n=1 Tax=Saccharomycopsis crataegensis TaxID=43959 RepID=A0AAV5QRL6_9ASCO|nr:Aha1 protein [Saccharomycopsis crataegensis]
MVVNNPNNWHWVDKNCIDWTKQYFKSKLPGLASKDSSVKITEVRSIEGDVEVCQRKGKVISLFDLKLVMAFESKVENQETVTGSITVPEVAYDTEEDEYQFNISIDNDNNRADSVKSTIRKDLEGTLRKALFTFGKDLILSQGNDIQLPEDQVNSTFTKSNQKASATVSSSSTAAAKSNTTSSTAAASASTAKKSTDASVPKYNTSTLHLEATFTTTTEQIYETFLDPARVAAWTRAVPLIEPKEGGVFELFHGNIEGKFLKLDKPSKIVMLWRLKDWKAGHFANLEINFFQGDSDTKADIMFTGIPIGEEEKVEGNFQEYYIRAIKLTFGFGIVL